MLSQISHGTRKLFLSRFTLSRFSFQFILQDSNVVHDRLQHLVFTFHPHVLRSHDRISHLLAQSFSRPLRNRDVFFNSK